MKARVCDLISARREVGNGGKVVVRRGRQVTATRPADVDQRDPNVTHRGPLERDLQAVGRVARAVPLAPKMMRQLTNPGTVELCRVDLRRPVPAETRESEPRAARSKRGITARAAKGDHSMLVSSVPVHQPDRRATGPAVDEGDLRPVGGERWLLVLDAIVRQTMAPRSVGVDQTDFPASNVVGIGEGPLG